MVKIKVEKNNDSIKSLVVSGHADFADYGKDIVCASISSICIGLLNSIDILDNQSCLITTKGNYIRVEVICDDDIIQVILNVGIIQLKTLEESFPDNLKIEFTEV